MSLPNILVFDDEYELRKAVFESLLAGLAVPVPQTFFTLAALERGETTATVKPKALVELNPVAVILDLVIVRREPPDVFQGLQLLSNLRQIPYFENLPIFVVSDYSDDPRLSSRFLDEPTLEITARFEWIRLASQTGNNVDGEQLRFRKAIENVTQTKD